MYVAYLKNSKEASMDLSAFNYISMFCSFIYFLKLIYLDRFKIFNCDLCKRNTCEVSRTAGHSYLTYPFLEEIFVILGGGTVGLGSGK